MPILFALLTFAHFAHAANYTDNSGLDGTANAMVWIVMCIVPMAGLYVFWMVHIYPEKVAEERDHPQKDAIKILCLLSLVFGGLLWPFALVWAYMKSPKIRVHKEANLQLDESHELIIE
ncbi:uncharacterized protein DUF3302 [Sediminitomix flava]|uniref:Uncharacterized protein DUF3302 n=2 Tax=Sediminitomix flava TaxID=379075 RepID=A0A315ZIG0_SEDFL|nr:uncharacterized protein DUF3302 [Sediminitomix flava]